MRFTPSCAPPGLVKPRSARTSSRMAKRSPSSTPASRATGMTSSASSKRSGARRRTSRPCSSPTGTPTMSASPSASRSTYGVPVFVGAADADEARGKTRSPPRPATRSPPPAGRVPRLRTHQGRRAADGVPRRSRRSRRDDARRPGSPVVIPLPGHTPGSVAYHVPMADAIFMGGAMTTRSVVTGVVGPALGPFTVDPYRRPASLGALDGLAAGWVLPGHGDAWTGGLPEALRRIQVPRAASAA